MVDTSVTVNNSPIFSLLLYDQLLRKIKVIHTRQKRAMSTAAYPVPVRQCARAYLRTITTNNDNNNNHHHHHHHHHHHYHNYNKILKSDWLITCIITEIMIMITNK